MHYLGREDKFKAGLAKEKRLTSIAMGEGFGSEEMAVAAELLGTSRSFLANGEERDGKES